MHSVTYHGFQSVHMLKNFSAAQFFHSQPITVQIPMRQPIALSGWDQAYEATCLGSYSLWGVSIVTMVKLFYFKEKLSFFTVNFLSISDDILKGTGLLAGSTLPLRICLFTYLQLFSFSVIIRGSSFVV